MLSPIREADLEVGVLVNTPILDNNNNNITITNNTIVTDIESGLHLDDTSNREHPGGPFSWRRLLIANPQILREMFRLLHVFTLVILLYTIIFSHFSPLVLCFLILLMISVLVSCIREHLLLRNGGIHGANSEFIMMMNRARNGMAAAAAAGGGRLPRLDPLNLQLSLLNREFTPNDYELLLALDNSVENTAGAMQSEIDMLPRYNLSSAISKHQNCSVCLENMAGGEEVRTLPCMHLFHLNCIDTWLRMQANCPVCKVNVF